jgi:hypothetical protein
MNHLLLEHMQVFDEIDSCYLECDGLTRVISSTLSAAGVAHTVYVGKATWVGKSIAPHLWIELPDGRRIDYRLRLWLGITDSCIPHGLYEPSLYPDAEYIGREHPTFAEDDAIAEILGRTAGFKTSDLKDALRSLLLTKNT